MTKLTDSWACNCIGPQRGEPYCPCSMRARRVYKRDGRWIEPERDLGPVCDLGPVVSTYKSNADD